MPSSLLDRPRARLAFAVRRRIAGDDFDRDHAQIWNTPGERWFAEQDPIWIVHADISMLIGGIRALLLQSLHPVAMLGVSQHSGFRGDPWGRLQRTSRFLATTTYGTVDDAERLIRRVTAIHARVTGVDADGHPYRADDPHLLKWVHVAEIDSFLTAHRAFGSDPLTEPEYDRYVEQTGRVAARLGVVDPPGSRAELDSVIDSYRPALRSSGPSEDARDLLLRDPPLRGPARIGYAALAAGAVSLLPTWARAELGLVTLPIADRLLSRPFARRAAATLRWALSAGTASG